MVRVRTLPSAPTCIQNLAMLSPLAVSTMLIRSNSPLVRLGLLDVDTELLGHVARGGGALGSVLDVADSLLRPIHGDDARWHDRILPLLDKRDCSTNDTRRRSRAAFTE